MVSALIVYDAFDNQHISKRNWPIRGPLQFILANEIFV